MRKKMKKWMSALIAAAVMLGGIQMPVAVKAQESGQTSRSGVTVSTPEQFMAALQQKNSPITVNGLITIGKEADANGRMRPVKIPGGTVIKGSGTGSDLNARCPIQIDGDNVQFQNIKLTFESSTALGSVPHREIYLAGHSLTLDNVNTYLEGSDGSLGGFGGFEAELLPSVYAGGYPGTSVGSNASLTVKNSNDKTMFQAIHMGHGTENGVHASYQGEAVLNLDAKAVVREGVDTSQNTRATINMTGGEYSFAKAKKFVGNADTTLTLNTVSITEAEVDSVGNVVLENKSCISPKTNLQNITLKSGACLDYTGIDQAKITGNFTGTASNEQDRGMLVLKPEGLVVINGNITGTTQFQTEHRLFPGMILTDHEYIYSNASKGDESNFVLAQKSADAGFELRYTDGVWTGYQELEAQRMIGRIEVLAAPSKVNIRKIEEEVEEGVEPTGEAYFEIKWYDKKGEVISNEEVVDDSHVYYETDYIFCIKTSYWESGEGEDLDKTDWWQHLVLVPSKEYPGRYYLQKRAEEISEGTYTFLFLSDSAGKDLDTVGDVKALKDTVMREQKVVFYDNDTEQAGHIHTYKGEVTKEATCMAEGVMTYKCTYQGCTENYEGKIAVSEHKFQETVTQEATCTEPGIKTYICSGCNVVYADEIPKSDHKEVIDQAVEPTETEDGKTEGSHCSVCNKVIKPQEVIPATGHKHSYQEEETKKATCTEEGIKTYICSCGDKKTEKIPLADHQYKEKRTPATINADGKVQQICAVCSDIKTETVISSPRITWGKTDFSYDGKVKTPAITVKDTKGKSLTAGTDYQIVYAKGRKNPGVYTSTVEFRGNYSGKVTESFKIRPKKTSLKKVVAKSKGMQVSWKKQTAQMDGYQIQYSTKGSFKGKTTGLTTAKKSAASKKISKLKGKKKYYVRIRTYKTVKVNGKKVKLYSDWSAKKSVKTKK